MTSRALTAPALAAGLWIVGVTAAGGVLAAAGWWTPWVAWPVAVLVAVAAALLVRRVPVVAMTARAAVAMVALVVGFAVYAGVTHSEHVLPATGRREQPPGGGQHRDDARAGRAGRRLGHRRGGAAGTR